MSDGVRQLRLVVTVEDDIYEQVVALYRGLGMPLEGAYTEPAGGRVSILEAGRATLEITDTTHAGYIDSVEVGERAERHLVERAKGRAPKFRLALEVDSAEEASERVRAAGGDVIAAPVRTPWNSLNARLAVPGGVQLTLFEELG